MDLCQPALSMVLSLHRKLALLKLEGDHSRLEFRF